MFWDLKKNLFWDFVGYELQTTSHFFYVAVVKTIYREEYRVMCELLREYREKAGLTQDELADKLSDSLGWQKSQVGKVERGERRIDVFELKAVCDALNVPVIKFWNDLERHLACSVV